MSKAFVNTDRDLRQRATLGRPSELTATAWEALDQPRPWWKELPAWLLSLLFHGAVLVGMALVVRASPRGVFMEPARGGGIVLARDVDGTDEYFAEGNDAASAAAKQADSQVTRQGALPGGQQVPVDVAGALPAATSPTVGSGVGDALPSASGFASGARPGRGSIGGNQTRTNIFGAQGTGNKFVYVFDRSASMDGYQGRPLAAAKRELIASLNDLDQIHQFQIVFYNEQPTVFNPSYPQPPRMLFGDSPTKRLAQNFVGGIVATDGTGHLAALRLALGMQPDVIFFLTDAGEPPMSSSDLEDIRHRNIRVGAVLNVIEFGAGPNPGDINFLVRLAQQNGGQYVYVDVTRLPSAAGNTE